MNSLVSSRGRTGLSVANFEPGPKRKRTWASDRIWPTGPFSFFSSFSPGFLLLLSARALLPTGPAQLDARGGRGAWASERLGARRRRRRARRSTPYGELPASAREVEDTGAMRMARGFCSEGFRAAGGERRRGAHGDHGRRPRAHAGGSTGAAEKEIKAGRG